MPRVKPSVPQCLCTSEPSRVRKVPKNKQVKRTSLLFREIENASTNDVQITRNSKDRSDVAAVFVRQFVRAGLEHLGDDVWAFLWW